MSLGMKVGLGPGDFVLDGDPAPSSKRGEAPNFRPYCDKTAGWIKMALGMEVGLGPGHIAPSSPPQKGGRAPNFRPISIVARRLDVSGYHSAGQHCVRWGPSSPSPKGAKLQFSANARCSQTAGWTKMPLGMDVGIGPGDFVFGGDPAPPPRKEGTAPSQFLAPLSHVYCGQTAGWIKIPLGTDVNLGLGDVVLDGVAVPP